MFKKWFPLTLVLFLVLLSGYATFRIMDAQTHLAAGARIGYYNSLFTSDLGYQGVYLPGFGAPGWAYTNVFTSELLYPSRRAAGPAPTQVNSSTNVAAGDLP